MAMNWQRRLRNRAQFQLEQFMLRGVMSRLAVIALTMVLIAAAGGLFVYVFGQRGAYDSPGAAVWWAFLRLTDSGYLGDDQGPVRRTVSTLLTVFGVVLFIGALIATMTQWLNDTIERLEGGYTPIAENNHVLILGWNNRTASMVEDLVQSRDRMDRFLQRHDAGRLRIVILAEHVSPGLMQEIKDRLGRRFDPRQITLRSGTPLRLEHLKRVDYRHAAAILLPTREFEADSAPDELTIKTLMSAAYSDDDTPVAPDALPLVVAEIFDADRRETVRRAYPGPAEFIGTPLIISRLLAQNARHRGLSRVYNELLGDDGNQIYVRACPELVGARLADAASVFDAAVLLGAVRDKALLPLYADEECIIGESDRLAFIARAFEDCAPARAPAMRTTPPLGNPTRATRTRRVRRVLVLGWNQKLPSLLAEFDAYRRENIVIDVFSLVDIEERKTTLRRKGVVFAHARVVHMLGDLTSYYELSQLDIESYDNVILVASDWLGSPEAADARTLLGYLVLSHELEALAQPPRVLVEALSVDNAALFDAPHVERLVTPDLQASMLTQIALKRELHWVIEELFGAGGAEIEFRDVHDVDLEGRYSFAAVQRECAGAGETLLGFIQRPVTAAPKLWLNPNDKHTEFGLDSADELVVMTVYD